ncbi:MAG: hypothetical protein AAGC44_06350 [Planctomycetota bacterium]
MGWQNLVVQTGIADDPESWSKKPVLELPGKERIEYAEKLPELVAEIVEASKKLAISLGNLADQSREKGGAA